MTELEQIKAARECVDKLANGVNPLNDLPLPEGDIVNQVRVTRCLFLVSDVLRQVIESREAAPVAPKKSKKRPLEIPYARRSAFAYSDVPLSASEIARRVNLLVEGENMEKLAYAAIAVWLTEIGMLEWQPTTSGYRTRRPTRVGRENGIRVENRTNGERAYQVVTYDLSAQQFIVDNLDAILAAENMQGELNGAPWTKEQDEMLLGLYRDSLPLSEIARLLKRSTSAIHRRLRKLKA